MSLYENDLRVKAKDTQSEYEDVQSVLNEYEKAKIKSISVVRQFTDNCAFLNTRCFCLRNIKLKEHRIRIFLKVTYNMFTPSYEGMLKTNLFKNYFL